MHRVFLVGDEPLPGYRLTEDLGGSAFYKTWRVQTPDGSHRLWKIIDLVLGNAAVETRTLGLLVQLRHPHLNTLTNFWQFDDGKVLIIESATPNLSLRQRLMECQQQGMPGIPDEELQTFIEQAAAGLDFLNRPCHQFQNQQVAIYHRSLRPECLLLFEENGHTVCKISDFGLSKPVTEEVAQHSQGLVHYDYDPPEFFEGETHPTSDQYALAINYYELRTGKLPFQGSMLEQLQARLNDKPELSGIAEPQRSVIRKALSRNPADRFANSVEFARYLGNGIAPAVAISRPESTPQQEPTTRPMPARPLPPQPIPMESARSTPIRPPSTLANARPQLNPSPMTATLTPSQGYLAARSASMMPATPLEMKESAMDPESRWAAGTVKPGVRPGPAFGGQASNTVVSGRSVPTADVHAMRRRLMEVDGIPDDQAQGVKIPIAWVVAIVVVFVVLTMLASRYLL